MKFINSVDKLKLNYYYIIKDLKVYYTIKILEIDKTKRIVELKVIKLKDEKVNDTFDELGFYTLSRVQETHLDFNNSTYVFYEIGTKETHPEYFL